MLSKQETEEYCREYYLPIYKYCMSRLSNREDTEDAVQETFTVFAAKAHMLEKEHIKAWLFATAHNMVLKCYRNRQIDNERHDRIAEASEKVHQIEEELVSFYLEKYIGQIYERLNEREKRLFDLCSDGSLSPGQITELMGLEAHTCSMRKKRLKEKCREIMLEMLFL